MEIKSVNVVARWHEKIRRLKYDNNNHRSRGYIHPGI